LRPPHGNPFQLLRELPATVFEMWRMWWDKNCFGPNEEALRAAWPAVFAYNASHKGTIEPADLFPQLRPKEEKQRAMTPEEAVAYAKVLAAAWGTE
jgi:hypothetical protein